MNKYTEPFDHWIIDGFLEENTAKIISKEFLDYDNPNWFSYNNPLENKKTLNNWYFFSPATYQTLSSLNSDVFLNQLSLITNIGKLYPDPGLHGAGLHIHGNQGKLNLHLDYSIHPKLFLQRKLNVIIYLSEDWDPSWGGNLEFWSHNYETNRPDKKIKTIDVKFNRAIIFDTTQHSWHGFPELINCPENVFRKSIAMYYLCDPPDNVDDRKRALYSPTNDQQNDQKIMDFIIERSR